MLSFWILSTICINAVSKQETMHPYYFLVSLLLYIHLQRLR